jgi:hypothetical protein
MSSIPAEDIPSQLSKANDAITAATGRTPNLFRPGGGLSNDAVRSEAGRQGMAEILWDVIPFDWINDSNTEATIYMLKTQIKPGWVVTATRHLFQHRRPRLSVPAGAESQRLPPDHRQPPPRRAPARQQLRQPSQRPTGQRHHQHPRRMHPNPAGHALTETVADLPITDIPNQTPAARNNPGLRTFFNRRAASFPRCAGHRRFGTG